ncbi:replication endonuclease, partial [Burkholderia gladioli]|nr:replication endonuclease [Burkholderia gladioli]
MRTTTDHQWANALVADLPAQWAMSLLGRWERRRTSFNRSKVTAEGAARRSANEALRAAVEPLRAACPQVPLRAADHAVVEAAREAAEECRLMAVQLEREQRSGRLDPNVLRAAGLTREQAATADAYERRVALAAICRAHNVEPPEKKIEHEPALRRMTTAKWWTGKLRRIHGMAKETAAIQLGRVAKDRECYVSNVSVGDRLAQNERNAASLEATVARNIETDQEYTLAQRWFVL